MATRALSHLVGLMVRCPICQVRGSSLEGCCEACQDKLFRPIVSDDELVLGEYKGELERAVRALKFGRASRLAKLFGRAIASEAAAHGFRVDVVCPVPLRPFKHWQRGFNQAELIAARTASHLGVPHKRLLKKSRVTRQQARLSLLERERNVIGAFTASSATNLHVLLIDDVVTTGATTIECRLALFAAGASRVTLAAVARTPQYAQATSVDRL